MQTQPARASPNVEGWASPRILFLSLFVLLASPFVLGMSLIAPLERVFAHFEGAYHPVLGNAFAWLPAVSLLAAAILWYRAAPSLHHRGSPWITLLIAIGGTLVWWLGLLALVVMIGLAALAPDSGGTSPAQMRSWALSISIPCLVADAACAALLMARLAVDARCARAALVIGGTCLALVCSHPVLVHMFLRYDLHVALRELETGHFCALGDHAFLGLGPEHFVDISVRESALPTLVSMSAGPQPSAAVIAALSCIGSPRARQALLEIGANPRVSATTRASAIAAAGSALEVEQDALVFRLLGDDEAAVRRAAFQLVLANIQQRDRLVKTGQPFLLPADDPARVQRLASLLAMAALGPDTDIGVIASLLAARYGDARNRQSLLDRIRTGGAPLCDRVLQEDYVFAGSDSWYDDLMTAIASNPSCPNQAGEAGRRWSAREDDKKLKVRRERRSAVGREVCRAAGDLDRITPNIRALAQEDAVAAIHFLWEVPSCVAPVALRDALLRDIADGRSWPASVRAGAALALPQPPGAGQPQPSDALAGNLLRSSSVEERRRILFHSMVGLSSARSEPLLLIALTDSDPVIHAEVCTRMSRAEGCQGIPHALRWDRSLR
jgi:hypothetical protein